MVDLAEFAKEMIRTPARLKPGDTIGIVAPAGPFDKKLFERGLAVLESMGFQFVVSDRLFMQKGYLAGSDTHRADLINRLFEDQAIQAIVCARGGFGSMRILPLLDFELIRRHPKIFVGFSDVSALLSALCAQCQMVVFHGPVITTLADAPRETKDGLLAAVSSDRPVEIQLTGGRTIRPGVASGPVCGGNLTTLCHLVGTPFSPCFADQILFFEDRGEETYRIDRMLFQMKLAGCFDELAGLVLGTFTDCGALENIYKIIANLFADVDIPILAGLDAGHGNPNITIPMGVEATLDADRHLLTYHQAATAG
jgi:muramoyltetrapeptide carboxypeptidase